MGIKTGTIGTSGSEEPIWTAILLERINKYFCLPG
jgi:hypothetical protein